MATMMEPRPPVQPGESAPDFTLPSVDRDGTVSLDDYRGKHGLLLCLFRGLWCPFCRRSIARLGSTQAKLKEHGVETLGIVATSPENARLYGPTPNRWTVKCLCFLSSPKSLWSQKLPLRRRRRGVAACPAR